jgi:hypothetical protein
MKEHPTLKGYFVTEDGKVFSFRCNSGVIKYNKPPKELVKFSDKDGYLRVSYQENGKRKSKTIHRLVAETYLPNSNNYPQVNHKDEIKTNNNLSNLEWVSAQYNTEYSQSKYFVLEDSYGNLVEVFNLSKFCKEKELTGRNLYNTLEKHKGTRRYRPRYRGWKLISIR